MGDGGPHIHVDQVDDLVDLNPFVGATEPNRTRYVDAQSTDRYPVRYVLWQRTRPGGIDPSSTLDEVGGRTRQLALVAAPVRDADPTSAWLTAPREVVPVLRKLAETGEPAYTAHAGVFSGGTNGIYWLSVDGPPRSEGRVPITNLHDVGRTPLPKRYGRIERELVHPLVRGSDVAR